MPLPTTPCPTCHGSGRISVPFPALPPAKLFIAGLWSGIPASWPRLRQMNPNNESGLRSEAEAREVARAMAAESAEPVYLEGEYLSDDHLRWFAAIFQQEAPAVPFGVYVSGGYNEVLAYNLQLAKGEGTENTGYEEWRAGVKARAAVIADNFAFVAPSLYRFFGTLLEHWKWYTEASLREWAAAGLVVGFHWNLFHDNGNPANGNPPIPPAEFRAMLDFAGSLGRSQALWGGWGKLPSGKDGNLPWDDSDPTIAVARRYVAEQPEPVPVPVPVPTPPVIDVGDTPPLAALRVAKGDPASKIQKLLDENSGRAYLERGGVWTRPLVLKDIDAVNRGLFAFGTGPRPVIKTAAGLEAFTCRNVKGVTVSGVDFIADGKHATGRSHGLFFDGKIGTVDVADVKVWGFNQNVAFQDGGEFGAVNIDGLVSTHAEGAPSDANSGQGIYLAGCKGRPNVSNSVLAHNGRRDDVADGSLNGFRHGAYCQHGSAAPIFTDCILADNNHSGIQARSGVRAIRCAFVNNGISLYLVGGGASVEDFAIIGAHRWWVPDTKKPPGSWVGNMALGIVTAAHLFRGVIVGVPAQGDPQTRAPNGAKSRYSDEGCIQLSSKYLPHPDWSEGASVPTLDGVTVADNWPGPLVSGDAAARMPIDKLKRAAISKPQNLVEIRTLVNAATSGDASVTAAKLIMLARGAVGP